MIFISPVNAQFECGTDNQFIEEEYGMSLFSCLGNLDDFDYFYNMIDEVQLHRPHFYFVDYGYSFSYVCDESNLYVLDTNTNTTNAYYIAKRLLESSNSQLSNLQPSLPKAPNYDNFLPNGNFKNQWQDIINLTCDDITILKPSDPMPVKSGKLSIVIMDHNGYSSGGAVSSPGIHLRNISKIINDVYYENSVNTNHTYLDLEGYSKILNHELGHIYGLPHVHSIYNTCPDAINTDFCNPAHTSWGGSACATIIGSKNNTMFSGSGSGNNGFTPCQFLKALRGMISEQDWKTTVFNNCTDLIFDSPEKTHIIDCVPFSCKDIIVKSGNELIVDSVTIEMNKNRKIIIDQGARLILKNGATIKGYNNSYNYWEGITLMAGYGSQIKEYVDINNYPLDAPASFINIGDENSIKNAAIALKNKTDITNWLSVQTMPYINAYKLLIDKCETGIKINAIFQNPMNESILDFAEINTRSTGIEIINSHGISCQSLTIDRPSYSSSLLGSNSVGIILTDASLINTHNMYIIDYDIGMVIKSSFPLISNSIGFKYGDISNGMNYFQNLDYGIQVGSGASVLNTVPLSVENSRFGNMEDVAIYTFGEAQYQVYNNLFYSSDNLGLLTLNSGYGINSIYCNDFSENIDYHGVGILGDNRNTIIHSNDFAPGSAPSGLENAISMLSMPVNTPYPFLSEMFLYQSARINNNNFFASAPAGNTFNQDVLLNDLNLEGEQVYYFVNDNYGAEYKPTTQSNYEIVQTPTTLSDCSDLVDKNSNFSDIITLIPYDSTRIFKDTIKDYDILNDYYDYLLDQIALNHEYAEGELARVNYKMTQWAIKILSNNSTTDDLDLESFSNSVYHRALIGYYIQNRDVENAHASLLRYPRALANDDDFYFLQEINLKRLFFGNFNLSAPYQSTMAELDRMKSIIDYGTINSGYASALYQVYTRTHLYPELHDRSMIRNERNDGNNQIIDPKVSLFPNPTTGVITLESNIHVKRIEVYDLSNRKIYDQQYGESLKEYHIDLSAFNNGIYIIRTTTISGILTEKIIKI